MDAEGFKSKVLTVNHKLFRICLRFLENRQDAEDALQEVYVKLWKLRDKLDDLNSIEAFAVTITKNLCLDKLKSKRTFSIDDANLNLKNSMSVEKGPLQITENTENKGIINNIINALPEQLKLIIHLRDIEEYEFEEIHKITGLSMNNIRVNLSRARKLVKNEIIKIHEFGISSYK